MVQIRRFPPTWTDLSSTEFLSLSICPEEWMVCDRIPSTTPGAEPPRDARESGSARSHSTHLETSFSDRP